MTTPSKAQIEAAKRKAAMKAKREGYKPVGPMYNLLQEQAALAAAQVGETFNKERYDALPQYDPETIERCAQVADDMEISAPSAERHNLVCQKIAAAIRKLKDET